MFEIGSSLAAARRARRLELTHAEALTRIRAKQLQAIEEERWDELPGRAYARAFLRSYANCLDLDADLYVAEFEAQVPAEEEAETPPPPRRSRRRYPLEAAAVGVASAIVLGVLAFGGGGGKAKSVDIPSSFASAPPARATAPAHPAPVRRHAAAKKVDHRLVVRATRGNCWMIVRRNGPRGAVLYEGTLTRGSVARFAAQRAWIRLGAPSNVDIHRASKVVRGLPSGVPANVTL